MLRLEWDRSRYAPTYLCARVSEAQVQKAVLEELAVKGVMALAVDAGARSLRGRARGALLDADRGDLLGRVMGGKVSAAAKGMPDIVGVLPGGRALFVECKAPEWTEWAWQRKDLVGRYLRQVRAAGKLKPEQRAFLERAAQLGAACAVAWSPADLDQLGTLLWRA